MKHSEIQTQRVIREGDGDESRCKSEQQVRDNDEEEEESVCNGNSSSKEIREENGFWVLAPIFPSFIFVWFKKETQVAQDQRITKKPNWWN